MTLGPSEVTVVIACHNQMESLRSALHSLATQSARPHQVVIADDASTEPIEDLAQQHGCGFVTTRPHTSRRGARSLARQLGLMNARGRLIIHLDGDMIPSQGFMELAVRYYEIHGSGSLIQGPRRFCIRQGQLFPNGVATSYQEHERTLSYHQFTSDCFAVDRHLALGVGGWDPNFWGWGEEDIEFAYRCQELGGAIIHSPNHPQFYASHVDHQVNHAANLHSLRRNAIYFATKHPKVVHERSHLWVNMGVYLTSYRRKWWSPWGS